LEPQSSAVARKAAGALFAAGCLPLSARLIGIEPMPEKLIRFASDDDNR
jgi:hypothetical protein